MGSVLPSASFWVKRTEFTQEYRKFGPFWLPVSHHSQAELRIFGLSTLEIDYQEYHWLPYDTACYSRLHSLAKVLGLWLAACSAAAQSPEPVRDGNLTLQLMPARRKMVLATRNAFAGPSYFTAVPVAAIKHASGQVPSFGLGIRGYSRSYGATLADHIVRTFLRDGVMASALDEDSRYARKDHGSRLGRAGYALSHLVVCGRDSGRLGFNFAEVGGSAMAAGIANAYYPGGRTPNANLQRFGIAITADAGGNLLKEFWPDIRKWITGKRRCGPVLPQAFRDTGQSAVTARPL